MSAPMPPSYGPPRPRRGTLVAGLVVGLVVGAGGLGLAWALSSDGSGTDYAAQMFDLDQSSTSLRRAQAICDT